MGREVAVGGGCGSGGHEEVLHGPQGQDGVWPSRGGRTRPVAPSSDALSKFTALLRLTPASAAHFPEGEDEVYLGTAELGSGPKALEAAVVRGSKTHQSECPGGSLCSPTRREEGWQDPGRQTTSQPSVPLALSSPGAPASRSTHIS